MRVPLYFPFGCALIDLDLDILIEFALGNLPWRRLKDKEQIGQMKIKTNTPDLVADLPPEFLQFMQHLQALDYADRPDYDYLVSLLQSRYTRFGGTEETLYDWQQPGSASKSTQQEQLTRLKSSASAQGPDQQPPSPRDVESGEDENVRPKDVSAADEPANSESGGGSLSAPAADTKQRPSGFGLPASGRKVSEPADRAHQKAPPAGTATSNQPRAATAARSPTASEGSSHPGVGSTGGVYKLVANKKLVTASAAPSVMSARPVVPAGDESDDRAEQVSADDDSDHVLEDEDKEEPDGKLKSPKTDSADSISEPLRTPPKKPAHDDGELEDQRLDSLSSHSGDGSSPTKPNRARRIVDKNSAGPTKAVRRGDAAQSNNTLCCAGCSTM